jgi:hypothetical protein
MPKMNIINPQGFLQSMHKMNCGETPLAEISTKDFAIEAEATAPLPGFEPKPKYPHCCPNHTNLFNLGLERFMKFPNCCENHKKLSSEKWFSKKDYTYLPRKIVDTVTYTMHCVGECLNNPEWYKEITDYIHYTALSFGQFPEGYGPPLGLELYLHNVEENLRNGNSFDTNKKNQLLEYTKNWVKPISKEHQIDLTSLINVHQEWLKIFPFELSLFAHLKPVLENKIPILSGKGETNLYTGKTAMKLTSIPQLIEILVKTTTSILKTINTKNLYEAGLLPDAKKVQLELILTNRRLEIESLDGQKNTTRCKYLKLLKAWLKGEKTFLEEITPLLRVVEPPFDFTKDLIQGIKMLQKNSGNEACIMNIRENRPEKETSFRYWFKNFFGARYPSAIVTAEEEQGKGRIDLKVVIPNQEEKIVEFKGWWNKDKKNSPEQICSYMTDFEKTGYIFMINHLKQSDISTAYKNTVSASEMNDIENSWEEVPYVGSDFVYYESRHQFAGKEKVVRHFIFNVYF